MTSINAEGLKCVGRPKAHKPCYPNKIKHAPAR